MTFTNEMKIQDAPFISSGKFMVDRDLEESETGTHSPGWKLSIAYNAVVQAAKAALAVTGYRVPKSNRSHHYYTIQSLRFTLNADSATTLKLEAVQKKRNTSEYERAGTVSDREAKDALDLAKRSADAPESGFRLKIRN